MKKILSIVISAAILVTILYAAGSKARAASRKTRVVLKEPKPIDATRRVARRLRLELPPHPALPTAKRDARAKSPAVAPTEKEILAKFAQLPMAASPESDEVP